MELNTTRSSLHESKSISSDKVSSNETSVSTCLQSPDTKMFSQSPCCCLMPEANTHLYFTFPWTWQQHQSSCFPPVHPEQRESLEFLTSTMSSSHIMIQRTSSIHPSIPHLFLHSSLRLSRGVMDASLRPDARMLSLHGGVSDPTASHRFDWQEMRWCHDECGRCLFYTDELEDDCSCAASQMWSMMMSGNWALLQRKRAVDREEAIFNSSTDDKHWRHGSAFGILFQSGVCHLQLTPKNTFSHTHT